MTRRKNRRDHLAKKLFDKPYAQLGVRKKKHIIKMETMELWRD